MESSKKSIGNVILDYSRYPGKDLYSDGSIESEILEAFIGGDNEELLYRSSEWPILYHLSDVREDVLEWCNIDSNAQVLEIGSGCGAITGVLARKSKKVTCVELSERRSLINAERNKEKNNIEILLGNFQDIEPSLGLYDVITLIGVLEYAKLYIKCQNPYVEMLKIAKKHLSKNGKLIIAIENKMGLKYWNGAVEDHTGRLYSGLNDYVDDDEVRTFSYKELESLLNEANFYSHKFYCPVPDYKLPQMIYSYEFQPKPGAIRTYRTNYSKTRMYNFYEDIANDQLCSDGMFGYMANSYVVITSNQEEQVLFAKYNRERKEEYRISTTIKFTEQGIVVIKSPLSLDAVNHVISMKRKADMLTGVIPMKIVNGNIVGNEFVTNYIVGKTLDEIMYECRNSTEKFVCQTKEYLEAFYLPKQSELIQFEKTADFIKVFGDVNIDNTYSYKISNIDLLFSNIIIDENQEVYAFDFEWVFDFPIPYRYISWRAIKEVYFKYQVYLKKKLSVNTFYERLGFDNDEVNIYKSMEKSFGEYVCGVNRCEEYMSHYVKPAIMQDTRFC